MAVKAAKYRKGDLSACMPRLVAALQDYVPTATDLALVDDVCHQTQAGYFGEAALTINTFPTDVKGISELLRVLPLMGRTVTIAPPPPGISMEPWMLQVVGMPTSIKHTTAHHLLYSCLNLFVPGDEAEAPADTGLEGRVEALALADSGSEGKAEAPALADSGSEGKAEAAVAEADGSDYEDDGGDFTDWDSFDEGGDMEFRLESSNPRHDVYKSLPREADGRVPIPANTINHLLFYPSTVVNQTTGAPGVVNFATMYLTTRDPNLYSNQAYVSLMAATVTYLLEQPPSEEVSKELAGVRVAFHNFYTPGSADGKALHKYLDTLLGDDFRLCLATSLGLDEESKARQCPHLTKFILGLFLLASGSEAERAHMARNIRKYHLGLLVEFFHRAEVRIPFETTGGKSGGAWAAENLTLPDPDILAHTFVNRREAGMSLRPAFEKKLRGVAWASLGYEMRMLKSSLSTIAAARYYQFTVDSIRRTIGSLVRLAAGSLPAGELVPPAPVLDRVLPLLVHASGIKQNRARCVYDVSDRALTPSEACALGCNSFISTFRKDALAHFDASLDAAYATGVMLTHQSMAVPFPAKYLDDFERMYGVDLRRHLCITEGGLSGNRCCVATCPHFLKPLGPGVRGAHGDAWALSPQLKEHIRPLNVVPGLHKTLSRELRNITSAPLYERACPINDAPRLGAILADMVGSSHSLETAKLGTGAHSAEYAESLQERVTSAIACHSGGNPDWLREAMVRIIREEKTWSFDDFCCVVFERMYATPAEPSLVVPPLRRSASHGADFATPISPEEWAAARRIMSEES